MYNFRLLMVVLYFFKKKYRRAKTKNDNISENKFIRHLYSTHNNSNNLIYKRNFSVRIYLKKRNWLDLTLSVVFYTPPERYLFWNYHTLTIYCWKWRRFDLYICICVMYLALTHREPLLLSVLGIDESKFKIKFI